MDCEMCGKPATAKATIEGAQLNVCAACAKHGTNVRQLPQAPVKGQRNAVRSEPLPREEIVEGVRPDFAKLLRQHREQQKLNQEQFAAKLQIRASTYTHWESGAVKPDITVARKLEHILKVPLVVSMKMAAAPVSSRDDEARSMQLGDFVKRK